MADMRSFPKEFVFEFIKLYEKFPCLWKIRSKEYSNRNKKHAAYEVLVEKLQEIIPDADKDVVIKKLDSMRGSFRKEYKKVIDSRKSKGESDEIYQPRLWYFKYLLFLKDHEIQQKERSLSKKSLQTSINENDKSTFEERLFHVEEIKSEFPLKSNKSRKPERTTTSPCDIVTLKRKRSFDADDFDVFAKHLTNKLRKLPNVVETITEKLILDVVYQAELGYLDRNTSVEFVQNDIKPFFLNENSIEFP